MESKEALDDLFDILCEREHTNSEHSFWLKQYNKVKRDLDILEFFKGLICYTDSGLWYIDTGEIDFDLKYEMTKKEWDNSMQKKIKEWLKETPYEKDI